MIDDLESEVAEEPGLMRGMNIILCHWFRPTEPREFEPKPIEEPRVYSGLVTGYAVTYTPEPPITP